MGNQEPSVRGLLTRHCIVNLGKMRCTGKMHTGTAANAQGMPSLSGTPKRYPSHVFIYTRSLTL